MNNEIENDAKTVFPYTNYNNIFLTKNGSMIDSITVNNEDVNEDNLKKVDTSGVNDFC